MQQGGWVFVDSHERGVVRLALLPRVGRPRTRIIRRPRLNMVATCAQFFTVAELRTVQGICVAAGPGSFSAVRGGVLVANMLSRLLGKPLVGVSVQEAANLSALRDRLLAQAHPAVPYVAPVYDAEPNITC